MEGQLEVIRGFSIACRVHALTAALHKGRLDSLSEIGQEEREEVGCVL